MSYDVILFDLDGTLTDPGEGITNSVAYGLAHFGIAVEDKTTLYSFIGPPLMDSFQQFYGMTEAQAREAIEQYRVYFRAKGMLENLVYPGMAQLLEQLQQAGKTLLVATSKPEVFAVEILQHFGLDGYFTCIAGATLDGSRSTKIDVISHALAQCPGADLSQAVMVGDRKFDILGAQHFGLDSIGVLFGYGSREELTQAGATHLAETVDDLAELLLP
jgi:phosphoglycolate phosphatase